MPHSRKVILLFADGRADAIFLWMLSAFLRADSGAKLIHDLARSLDGSRVLVHIE